MAAVSRRLLNAALSVSLVIGVVAAVQFVAARHAARARADAVTGTSGLFTAHEGNLLDTRSGAGGITGPLTANTWYPVQAANTQGIPAAVSSVQVSISAITPSTTGIVKAEAAGTSGNQSPISALLYTANSGTVSAESIVPVNSNGQIEISATTSVNVLITIQGYYSAGNGTPAPGGYVPIAPARLADTRTGQGIAQAKLANNSTTAIAVGGVAGVPADAAAVFVMVGGINPNTANGYLNVYPTGTARPDQVSLVYAGSTTTMFGVPVALGTNGQVNVWVGPASGSINFVMDVVGYYTASSGTKGAFTPAGGRVYDSRVSPNTAIPANSSRKIQLGGINHMPLPGSGISAYALNAQVVHNGSNTGYLALGPGDGRTGTVTTTYFPTGSSWRNDLGIVPTAGDGTILLVNSSADPIDVILDVEGWYSGVGAAIPNGQTRTQQYLTLQADSSTPGSYVRYQYRTGTTGTWTDVPVSDVVVPGTSTHPSAWPVQSSGSPATFAPYTWDAAKTLGYNDQLFQVQACYSTTNGGTPVCSMASSVQLAAHSFGASYATTNVGPGSLSLQTGDFQVSATDASVATYQGSLSVGRTITTLAPVNGERTDASGIFGPGWTASLPGADVGDASLTVTDKTSSGGYLSFTDTDGSVSIYQATSPTSTYPISYSGIDDAAADGATVTKISASEIDMTDADGTKTVWTPVAGTWVASSVQKAGSSATTTYTRDASGRVTRILGAVPSGVSCASSPYTTPGCRSLELTYGNITVAGSSISRLQSVTLHAYDPATAAMAAPVFASYDYDASGRLAHAWDPRISPALKTAYTYDSNGRLATITPPGLATWTLSYDSSGKLTTVTRPDGTATATNTVAYGVPVSGSSAPVDLSLATAATWGQSSDTAVTGTAVYGPNHVPAGTPTSTDWPYATTHYLDVNGRQVNTAQYGAGQWLIDSTQYDTNGNTIWSLTAGNRSQALSPTADTDPTAAAATTPSFAANLLASTNNYSSDGSEVIDSYGPIHPVLLANRTLIDARSHTHTDYDEGAPSGGPYQLPTTVTTSVQDANGTDYDTRITHAGYDIINSSDPAEVSGWSLRQPTTSTTQMGASASSSADLVETTRFDVNGNVIETRLPSASAGGTADDNVSTYYTATGSGGCVSAAFVGLLCTKGPANQPSAGNPLPVTKITYDLYDQPVTKTETAGSTVRTTTYTYDAADRASSSTITVTPAAAGGTGLPAQFVSYSSTTGLPTTVSAGGKSLTTVYDSLGRVSTYTDSTGNVTSTTYDLSGRQLTVNDGKATNTYTYDSAAEHRGMVTGEDLGLGAALGTLSFGYDSAGNTATVIYPNSLTAAYRFDNSGQAVALNYSMSGTSWMAFTRTPGSDGNTAAQTSPASSQAFNYDNAGRLTKTLDTAANNSTGTLSCTTRIYSLDKDGNRAGLASYADDGANPTSGHCTTATTPTTWSGTYDQADRLTTSGYTYDAFGRTLTVPAADATGAGSHSTASGTLNLGYYSNGFVAAQTQGSRTTSYTVDPLQGRVVDTVDTGAATSTQHFTSNNDSPAWTTTGTGTWSRNLVSPAGLVGTTDQIGNVTLDLVNLHGDVVATSPDTAASGPATYGESTEFGAPRTPSSAPDTYGWLGQAQRSGNALGGAVLMGARVYLPSTGRFLSADPVLGGNDSAYSYPANPNDQFDLSGQCNWWRHFKRCVREAVASSVGQAILSILRSIVTPMICSLAGVGGWICGAIVGGMLGAAQEALKEWAKNGHVDWVGVIAAGVQSAFSGAGLSKVWAAKGQQIRGGIQRAFNIFKWWLRD